MFNSPISKSQEELVHAARTATTDYIQNGTDLTEAVVKAASAIQPLTQEHVRRICEMTYHDAYERLFAEKTGMYQYVTFDPPDAIKASEMLDAMQMEVAHQPLLNKLASTQMDKKESDKYATRNKEASAAIGGAISAGIGAISGAASGDTTRQRVERALAGGALGGAIGAGAGSLLGKASGNAAEISKLKKTVEAKQTQVNAAEQAARKSVQQADAAASETSNLKNVSEENLNNLRKKIDTENIEKATSDIPKFEQQVQLRTVSLRNAKQNLIGAGLEGRSASDPSLTGGQRFIIQQVEKATEALREAEDALAKSKSSAGQVKTASMPRKFQRMNTHELWVKAASGAELPDHNPTRELQQVHRDLKDSISTVKSDLYSAEQNEKLAMIDMVKQAKAGLSAGHSMEQVLHAALSVVDTTEPFMAKTAHDLCATIIEACADHQNSGFRKEALMFVSPQEAIRRGRENDKSGRSLLGKMLGNDKNIPKTAMVYTPQEFDQTINWYKEQMKKNPNNIAMRKDYESLLANKSSLIKSAEMLQEANPNHPIPQKFKKLAEANIQRKHLEVTLDELNRNMNYFNEQLKNELFR